MKELTEKQKAARKLVSDYLGFLTEHEALVDRLVERKLVQMGPQIEQRIAQMIDERLSVIIQQQKSGLNDN